MTRFTLPDLATIVAERATASPEASWTAKLMAAGPERVAKKFGEEAVEAVIAAVQGDKAALTAEAADVLFHLLVLLQVSGVALDDVMSELERRTGESGLAEKAARRSK
ncbi:MAG: phosphoribosyl-ATP diphosphatase [Hyphomicrobiales bacterium]|jgi:phosphoribosyl-ATP pyrophosphohydrolase|nr:phosphoribosyl-ATP diphosphatase [Hyphomicrobiales bacterium]